MSANSRGFRRAGIGLVVTGFLAPFSATKISGPLSMGRATAVLFGVLLALDLLRERPRRYRFDLPALLLIAAYVGLFGWILVSAASRGCNCDGRAGGFAEFAMVGALSLVAIGFAPWLRRPALTATLSGLALAGALALAGVGELHSGSAYLTQTGGRLSGTYGNANELGFAMALGIPIAVAFRSVSGRLARAALAGSLLVLVLALILTFSRGAIVAAAAGLLALALWEVRRSRRNLLIVLGAGAACVLVGAVLYSVFAREREDVSFDSVSPALRPLSQRDATGWDSRGLGPVPSGPSQLSNDGGGIAVRSDRAGEGISFRWGEARPGRSFTMTFRARAPDARLPFSYTIGDGEVPANRASAVGRLGPAWRDFSLTWRPRLRSPHASIYMWQRAGPSTFLIADARIRESGGGAVKRMISLPPRLEGSIYAHLTSAASRAEHRYVRSRLDAAHLALKAFASQPLLGIGWATFPAYSDEHLSYGQLAAHDEYLSFAAELGVIGLLGLGLMICAWGLGLRRAESSTEKAAALGILATALAGMVFVEALPVPQLSIPIALAAAVLCAPRLRERG